VTIMSDISLAGASYAPTTAVALSYSDVPGTVAALVTFQSLVTAAGQLTSLEADSTITGTTASGTLNQATLAGATALTLTKPRFTTEDDTQQVLQAGATGSSYSLDLGATLLHHYTDSPTYATHTVSWTADATGAAPDFAVVAIDVERSPNSWTWTLAAPLTGTTVAFPILPTDIFDYNGEPSDDIFIGLLDSVTVPGGYDAVRAHVFTTEIPPAALGASGTAVLEQIPDDGLRIRNNGRAAITPRHPLSRSLR
jgi:hypothetical protein